LAIGIANLGEGKYLDQKYHSQYCWK